MLKIVVFTIVLVIGKVANIPKSMPFPEDSEELPARSHHENKRLNLQLVNGTATTLTIWAEYDLDTFPDIKWLNVIYWPLRMSCNGNESYNKIKNNSKYETKMLQVKLERSHQGHIDLLEWKNILPRRYRKNNAMVHLYDLYPNESYGICIEINQLEKGEESLAMSLCNCRGEFNTTTGIGKVQHLYFNQVNESETPMMVEWSPPAGFEFNRNITYNICTYIDDSVSLDSSTNSLNKTCSVSTNLRYDIERPEENATFTVCVSGNLDGINNSDVCINSLDSVCGKQLTINATISQTNDSEVKISLRNANCNRYHIHVVCHNVPTCKTISDCNTALRNDGNGLYKFEAKKGATYKILVYYVDENSAKQHLVATTEYHHKSDYYEEAVTEDSMDTSISVNWIRPWNIIQPVTITTQIAEVSKNTFKNFVGCSFTVEKTNLEPYKNYSGSFDVDDFSVGVMPAENSSDGNSSDGNSSDGRSSDAWHNFNIQTKPGACKQVIPHGFERIRFNESKDAHPTVLYRLPTNMTGVIERVYITLMTKDKPTIYLNYSVADCKSGENCSINITNAVVLPDQNYTIEMYCKNANTALIGIKNQITIQTEPAVPKIGEDILMISKQKWMRTKNSSDVEVTISSERLDRLAGTIKYVVICYGKNEELPNVTHGYLKEFDVLKCRWNVTIDSRSKGTTLTNLDFNQKYAAVLYYKNDIAFTFSKILYFRTKENPTSSIVAVCLNVLIFIILAILSMYCSRLEKSTTPTLNLPDLEFYPSTLEGEEFHHRISKMNWKEELQELLKEPKIAIKKEFFSLSQKSIHGSHPPSTSIAEHQTNLNKNRYFDIIPYDFSRVVLQGLPGKNQENYINATYIHSYNVNCGFIACQGPKESTVHDFWRMVVEKNVRVIVMLTRCVEGREKCYKYWPSVTPLITPSNTSIQPLQETTDPSGDYTIRKFLVSQGWETQEVVQFHFTAWPDKKCPKTANFYSFISEVKSSGLSESSPVIVHCSAGVGRTGSFIALYNLLDEIHDDKKDYIDIFYQVLKMRCFRNYMVQTQSQYVFLYDSIFQLLQDNSGELPRNESADRMSDAELEELSEDESEMA